MFLLPETENFREIFHKICIAKILLAPKPSGVAKFCECELPWGRGTTGEKKKAAKLKQKHVLQRYASTDDLQYKKKLYFVTMQTVKDDRIVLP